MCTVNSSGNRGGISLELDADYSVDYDPATNNICVICDCALKSILVDEISRENENMFCNQREECTSYYCNSILKGPEPQESWQRKNLRMTNCYRKDAVLCLTNSKKDLLICNVLSRWEHYWINCSSLDTHMR